MGGGVLWGGTTPITGPLPPTFRWQQLPSAASSDDHQQRQQHHDDCHLSEFFR